MAVLVMVNIYVYNTTAEENISLNTPKFFWGVSKSGKMIKLKWKKTANVDGYIIYKNGKKVKNIKNTKKCTWTDTKVKANKGYKYRLAVWKKLNGKKIVSKKTYKIRVRVTNKESEKVNAANLTTSHKAYILSLNSSKKIKVHVKAGKKEKKKVLLSNKLIWSSSNEELATVDQTGRVRTNNNMKTGSLYIYARAHNGIMKSIKIDISNFAKPSIFKNMYAVDDEIKPLVTTYKNDITDVASYFEFSKPGVDIVFDIDDYGELRKSAKTDLDKDIEEKLYKILKDVPINIGVHKTYLEAEREVQTAYGTTLVYSILYRFANGSEMDYENGYSRIEIAPRWYFQFIEKTTLSR